MYAIHATYERQTGDGWVRSGQVPTFFLHPTVQGITSTDHAERIALDLLAAGTDAADQVTFHVAAVPV